MHISYKAKLALFVSIVLWASAFVGIRIALHGYSPGGLALLRFIIASVCMYFLYVAYGQKNIRAKHTVYLLLVGAVGVGGYNISLNYGEISVPAGTASFIISQSPIITSILAILFLKERVNFLGILGMLVSLFGVLLIFFSQNPDLNPTVGWFYILCATVISAAYSVMQKPFLKQYHALDVTAYALWGATLMLLFFLPDMVEDMQVATWKDTLAVIYLGIFPAAIAYAAWNYALAELSVARASNFLYFMPIIATLLGAIFLNEIPMPQAVIGGVIALVGVWIVNHSFHIQNLQKNIDL